MAIMVLLAALSCKSGTTYSDNIPTDNTVISRMKFIQDDANPGIENAKFTIELIGDTGAVIYNSDSLPVGTKIDSVVTQFTFQYAIAGIVMYGKNDTVLLNSTDTIDFTYQPLRLRVISVDYTKQRNYRVSVRVHNVNPDLYKWQCLTTNASIAPSVRQQALLAQDTYCWFVNNGFDITLYTSTDAVQWTRAGAVGLSLNTDVKNIIYHNGAFYAVADDKLYTSSDGLEWSVYDEHKSYVAMLGVFRDGLWCITKDEQGDLYTFNILEGIESEYPLPDNFPVKSAAKAIYNSPTGYPQCVVLGGVSRDGEQLGTQWMTQDMTIWVNVNPNKRAFKTVEDASAIYYGGRLLLLGGFDEKGQIRDDYVMQSFDDGLNWEVVSTGDIDMPDDFTPRAAASIFLSDDKYDIHIIGGVTEKTTLADVWKIRKNSIDWK